MKVQELRPHLQRQGLGPLYAVVGEEPYFRDLAIVILEQALLGETPPSAGSAVSEESSALFNREVVYGDETEASEILSFAEEVSFFAAKRMVIVKWADKLSARDGEALIPYLKRPNEATTLVFSAPKLDGRTKWVQELKKHGTMIDCAPLYEQQRAAWVAQQAKECGVQLDAGGLELMKDQAAEGLYVARNELEKLGAFLPNGQKGGAQEIEHLRGKSPGISVFDWSVAVARGDVGRAMDIVGKNLETGEAPLRMVGAFLWQLRRIWKVKAALEDGKDSGQAVRQAGIPPFRAREFVGVAQQWDEPRLRKAWELLAKADSALKGGKASAPRLVLDDLVMQLCQTPSVTRQPSRQKTGALPHVKKGPR